MISSSEGEDILRQMNDNLIVIRKLIELQTKGDILREVNRIASTPERRKMWILSDGELSTEQVSKKCKTTHRAVQYFVQDGARAGLVGSKKRGYPSRLIDFIPPDWEEANQIEGDEEQETPLQSQSSVQPTAESGENT